MHSSSLHKTEALQLNYAKLMIKFFSKKRSIETKSMHKIMTYTKFKISKNLNNKVQIHKISIKTIITVRFKN